MNAISNFSITKWDETIYQPISATMKLTKASVLFEGQGHFEGQASVEYLMMYTHFDEKNPQVGFATYVGLMRLEGTLHGKKGSFALIEQGKFENGAVHSHLSIIENSGTGELQGISGSGTSSATHGSFVLELNYAL